PSEKGGRPPKLLPREKAEVPVKYRGLRDQFRVLKSWLAELDRLPSVGQLMGWICEKSRRRDGFNLLFWPEFVQDPVSVAGRLRGDRSTSPSELAVAFLSTSYKVSPKTIGRLVGLS